MSQEILEKAIKKAVANGWRPNQGVSDFPTVAQFVDGKSTLEIGHISQPQLFIFNHEFAKALWGEDWPKKSKNDRTAYYKEIDAQRFWVGSESGAWFEGARWQYHLQQMVVADDTIAYLGENL